MMHKNIIIAGGSGTGKTSMLNDLSTAISATERIVVIEDSSELQLQQPHIVYREAQRPQPDGQAAVSSYGLTRSTGTICPHGLLVICSSHVIPTLLELLR